MLKPPPHHPSPIKKCIRPYVKCQHCAIRHQSILHKASTDVLQQTQHFRTRQYQLSQGTILFNEGEKINHCFTLYEGWIAIYKLLVSGKRQILRFALPGDMIGLQLDYQGHTSYGAQALTASVLCAYPHQALGIVLNEHTEVSSRLFRMRMRDMNLCDHHLLGTGRKNALENIAFLLLELYHRACLQTPSSCNKQDQSVYFPVTQEDIGDATGLTKIHVNRTLRSLTKMGLIQCQHKRLHILQPEKMAELAQFDKELLILPDFFV